MSNKIKPIVGVIYSDAEQSDSAESSLLAKYLAGLLFLGKYSSIRLVSLPTEKQKSSKNKSEVDKKQPVAKEIKVLSTATKEPVTIYQSNEFQMNSSMDDLKDCHVIIVCVNPTDTERVAKALSKLPKKDPMVGIFSFQYGCKNYDALVGGIDSKDHVLFDGAVGFHVVEGVTDKVLRPQTEGSLVLERLSKEKEENGGGNFVNLLSTMDIPLLFRKALTPFTWGGMVFSCGQSINALTGGSMQQFMSNRSHRLLYAQMIRECLEALQAAAKMGDWHPDGSACCGVSLSILEQALCLPNLVYPVFAYFFLNITKECGSPVQVDLHHGRNSNGLWCLSQLTEVGSKYHVEMPACLLVHSELKSAIEKKNGVPSMKVSELMKKLENGNVQLMSTNQLIRSCFIAASAVFGLWFFMFMIDVMLPREQNI